MKWLMQLFILSVVFAAGTWFGGWWLVPVIGGLFGAWAASQRLVLITATLAGAMSWGALLAYDASAGPLGQLLHLFGAILHVPGSALVVLAIAFASLLAVSAAAFTRGVRLLATTR